ncbi:MAG: CHASE domain-containing protein [Rhodospirillaceae bacterium]|nr:CHASE domain-containing protein [Rhodospirillaceae bacterium]
MIGFLLVRSDSRSQAQITFDFRRAEITHAIEQRMAAYTEALLGGLGLLRASSDVTRDDWRRYVEALDLHRRYPGIQGYGFAEWVTPDRRPQYEAAIRAQGFPDFTIRPEGERELYSSITYLEPFDERNRQAFGFDMYSQETRRAAMSLARDTGEVAISGKVRLVQEITSDVQAGFLMYVPFYGRDAAPATVEERRAASIGFVYSPFRVRDLMEGIMGPGLPNVRLQIYDDGVVSPDGLMYDSEPGAGPGNPAFESVTRLDVGQHAWMLRITSLPPFEALLDWQKSAYVFFGGIAASVLLFWVLRTHVTMRARAEALAAGMTVALELRNEDLARSNAELEQFAYVASHDLRAPLRGIDHLAVWIEKDLGDKLDGEPKRNMAMLRNRIRRLDALLRDILDYSRAGRSEGKVETVNIRELVREAFDMVKTGDDFVLRVDAEPDMIAVKRTAIEQILINLFSNTIKHHDRSAGEIHVRMRDLGDRYEFLVADDGPGIPETLRERAFMMFQTLRPRDEVEGSGMGLAIIRKSIEHQGGTIDTADGLNGRGIAFRFTWPKSAGRGGQP